MSVRVRKARQLRAETARDLLALVSMEPNVFSHVIRWLLERIEHFPIPLEEALWAYAYCLSGPPGHESFSFSLPPYPGLSGEDPK